MYYFVQVVASISMVLLIYYFVDHLFWSREKPRWILRTCLFLMIVGFCILHINTSWIIPRTIYFIVAGTLFTLLFYETKPWQAVFASAGFFALTAVTEVFVMVILGLFVSDTNALMQFGNARVVFVLLCDLMEILLIAIVSQFFRQKERNLDFRWLLPIIGIQFTSIAVCYVVQYHTADDNFPTYIIPFMAVLLMVNIAVIFYVEAVRASEQAKYHAMLTEQQYQLQTEYYRQLHESQEETKALWHDIKKYILAMQAVAEKGDTEEAKRIVQQATDAFDDAKNISAVGNPVVDAVFNKYLRAAQEQQTKITLDVTIPEVLPISPIDLSIVIGNTLDNALDACLALPAEQRLIQICLRKQNRILFYRVDNPYMDGVHVERSGKYHGYGLKNVKRIVEKNGGDFQTEKANGMFTVSARMNCEI